MKPSLPALLLFLLVAALAMPNVALCAPVRTHPSVTAAPHADGDFRADLDLAREKVYPALVNIAVVARFFEGGRAERSPAGGSGVIISPTGYVLTNFHVAGHTTSITCATSNGSVYTAHVVGQDSLSDISVLKLDLPKGHAPMKYAVLGDSDKMQVGDFVLAMGNPLMLSSSMTLGIVSNTKRVFTDFTGTEIEDQTLDSGERTGVFTRWIQHDALILPGNSGGPLVNLKGQVIGINELGGDGVGFAIPSNIAKSVFEQILRYGRVRRGWLGMSVMPVQKIGRKTGALVSSVTPDSPAEKAGVKPGEIVTAINGKPTNVVFFEQVPLFYQQVAELRSGETAKISLLEGSRTVTKDAVVQWMQPYLGHEEDFPSAGLTVRSITAAMAIDAFLPSAEGVLVTGVRPGYPFDAAQPPIEAGDVITSLAGHTITDMASFRTALDKATSGSQPGDKVLVAFRRNDQSLLGTVVPVQLQNDNSGGELPQAWIGIKTQVMLPDIAASIGEPNIEGFRVTEIYPYTAASKCGLDVGDVITKLNGTPLDATRLQDADEFEQAVEALNVGDTAMLSVDRNGADKEIEVKLDPQPDASVQAKTVTQNELEFGVREINDLDRFENHWAPSQQGLLVTNVTMGGYASIAGLQADDLIVSIDGNAVSKIGDLKAQLDEAMKTKPQSIEVFVRRDASTQFVFIEPDWSKLTKFTEQESQ